MVGQLGSALRSARVADFSPEHVAYLTYGRGLDTSRMREVLGFTPQYSTSAAFADFADSLGVGAGPAERVLAGLEDRGKQTLTYHRRAGIDRGVVDEDHGN